MPDHRTSVNRLSSEQHGANLLLALLALAASWSVDVSLMRANSISSSTGHTRCVDGTESYLTPAAGACRTHGGITFVVSR